MSCISSNLTPYTGTKVLINTIMPASCVPPGTYITVPISSDNVNYVGPNLENIDVETMNNLTLILQKIDNKLLPSNLVNAIIQAIQQDNTLRLSLCSALNC